MQLLAQYSPSLAGQLAEDLLKAWLSGNPVKVRAELERSISIPVAVYDTGEQERRDLLKAVAGRMRKYPDLLEVEKQNQHPEWELYVRLLGHMVPMD
jgi:hypothetical protein